MKPIREPEPVLVEKAFEPRGRLLPRSILGITALVLSFAVGAAFSGAVLYSYYEFKKDTTEKRVVTFIDGFGQRFDTAVTTIDVEANNARAEIQKELEPLRKTRAEGQILETLIKKVEPSTFFVNTLDEAGQPSVGSGFAVASDDRQTLLLTSYNTVKAATRQPGPTLGVRKGNDEIKSTLWTWDEGKDLALIVLAKGSVPTLSFAPDQLRPGERIFAVSGLGGSGASMTQGFVADVSSAGLQHDAAVGQAFQGGPLVNSDGGVVAVASRSYAPLGFTSDQVYFAPFVQAACERVLRCSGGAPGAGARG
jgi:S1-C subfamily serine protease